MMRFPAIHQYLSILLLIGTLCFSIESAAETILGRWCDAMVPNFPEYNAVISIVITDSGAVEGRLRFNDGSMLDKELVESADGVFETVGLTFGDKYRVVKNTGELQLLDDEGLIRIATRLENSPQPGECGK